MVQYDKFADIYDVDLGKIDRDLKMYSMLIKNNEKVLILSCGTGRETQFFSNIFEEVWGLDISHNMLNEARKKTSNLDNIKYVEGDMSYFNLGCEFDAIIIPNNGILHLLKIDDIEKCLVACKNHLKKDGVLLLDFFLPDYKALSSRKSEKIHDFTRFDENLKQYITRERIHIRDTFNKLNHTQIFYEFINADASSYKRVCEYTIRYLFSEEFELLTRIVGLVIENKYGGFNFESFGAQHQNVVYSIRKD